MTPGVLLEVLISLHNSVFDFKARLKTCREFVRICLSKILGLWMDIKKILRDLKLSLKIVKAGSTRFVTQH